MMGSDSFFLGGGLMWIFWIILIVIMVFIFKGIATNNASPGGRDIESPMDILKKRYARGEIDEAEFEKRRKSLEE